MAKRLIWSNRSRHQLREILEYWNQRNQSRTYSRKLNGLFEEAAELLVNHPLLGRKTSYENIRLKMVRDYWMVYRIRPDSIEIILIWDVRRNPKAFENLLSRSQQ